ncbi:hypothetical protein JCM15765_36330 [Paradesulfitobacterium aromaticivorans]
MITLQVYHHRLKVPLKEYLDTVQEFTDPWDERAYQYFANKHLEQENDPGIVGMVRQERDDDYVYLDAAVRYPVAE